MDTDERIKALNDEFQPVQEELKKILYDIRTWIMEAQSPIPNDLERGRLDMFLNQNDSEKQDALRAQIGSEKGVKPDGNREES
jgi:hypothetical protein